ncbi:hypothetical protein ABBQ38_004114 [Trebouxia sp. C0009 RCD-2024]
MGPPALSVMIPTNSASQSYHNSPSATQVDVLALRLVQDVAFQQAVQRNHVQAAAKAAVALLGAFYSDTPGTSPNFTHFAGREFKEGDRVLVTSSSRKMNQSIVGKEGQVTQVLTNGWVNIFISSLRVNEQVQQRYLAHIEPGRVGRGIPAHPSGQESMQQQPASREAGLIDNFPDLPHDLDGFVGGLDGDLFLEGSHPMSLAMPSAALRPSSGGAAMLPGPRSSSIFADIPMPASGFSRPGSAVSLPASLQRHEVVETVQKQLVEAEDSVPWTAVRRHWKGKRNTWRKAVRQASSIPELGRCIKELKAALTNDGSAALECSATWQESLEDCCQGNGSHLLLHGVWGELHPKIYDWLQNRSSPRKAAAASLQDSIQRGISAMQQVFHNSDGSADAMAQVPLEQICNYEADTAKAIRDKLCRERQALLVTSNSTPSLLAANVAANERTIGTAYDQGSESDTHTLEVDSEVTDMSDSESDV